MVQRWISLGSKIDKENINMKKSELREIACSIKDFDVKFLDFTKSIEAIQKWQEWIDKIIEKIKKVLPI